MHISKTLPMMIVVALAAQGCGPNFQSQSLSSVAGGLNDGVTCTDARAKIFEAYNEALSDESDISGKLPVVVKGASNQRYQKSLQTIHDLLTVELRETRTAVHSKVSAAAKEEDQESEDSDLLHLARLEMRSQIEPQYDVLNKKLDAALAEAAVAGNEAGVTCAAPQIDQPTSEQSQGTVDSFSLNSPIYGALYTMATSYQSCQVLSLQPVSASTTSAQGVVRGAKVDAVGYGRVYTDVALLKRTHYYHRGQTYGPGCADQSRKPMVYDYGGRPVASTGKVDMFTNSGGGSAMGIDCSAFISTAAAVAGNLYTPSSSESPVYRRFVSRDFINPVVSKWGCYKSVTPSAEKSIQPGDIGAVAGHVVMVDKTGKDPFGIAGVKTAAGCSSLSVRNFDFTVVQSSPEKGSVGINRFVSKDYLAGGGKMATLFLSYAKAACLARFDGRVRNPVASTYGIIRHQPTAMCVAKRTALVNESCVNRCSSLREFDTN